MKTLKTVALAGLLSVGEVSIGLCEDLNIQQHPKKIEVPVGPDRTFDPYILYSDVNIPTYSLEIVSSDYWLLNSVMREIPTSSKQTYPSTTPK